MITVYTHDGGEYVTIMDSEALNSRTRDNIQNHESDSFVRESVAGMATSQKGKSKSQAMLERQLLERYPDLRREGLGILQSNGAEVWSAGQSWDAD